MSATFRWLMRHGAKLLFAFAIFQFLAALIPLMASLVSETGRMAQHHGYTPEYDGISFGLQLQVLLNALGSAAFPLFGALVIDRLDRWLAIKEREAGR